MGQAIIKAVEQADGAELGAALDRTNSHQLDQHLHDSDVVIDFTAPDASVLHAKLAARIGKAIVIGTTGLSDGQMTTLQEAARSIPIVYSPNTSVGVNLFWHTAQALAATCGDAYTVTIDETHHVHKKDAPSGTAKRLHSVVAEASGRKATDITVTSQREGEVIGDHAITFESDGDTITIAHHAKSRAIFAEGAVRAAMWVVGKPVGLYGMGDVLGLSSASLREA
jgi:4-hydroxy-tetrahydrodipicolinate reductase